MMHDISDNKSGEFLMEQALLLAQEALDVGEVPIGAIIVDSKGVIIGRGRNRVEKDSCQLGHAEIGALREACAALGDWRLNDCWLYVTLEPCLMCLGALTLSRIKGIVYAAPSPDFGALKLVNFAEAQLYFKGVVVVKGLKEAESVAILGLFFNKARHRQEGAS